ncbi:MAG: UDP-N-acetylglucosamine 2-epimerase (non-hydrolyzing) [Patescibacteria group bacterium]
MKKIISIVGTRPNFIKLAPVADSLLSTYKHIIVNTGQHYNKELSKNFFDELKLPEPKYNLKVGSKESKLQITSMFIKLCPILEKEKPSLVLIYGDTNSSLAGSLASAYNRIPIAHIEAGIRCFDNSVPEEVNRVIIDQISALLFCPTQTAVENLKKESIHKNIHFTGDVMYDIFLKTKPQPIKLKSPKKYFLATIHRQENTNNNTRLLSIFKFLNNQRIKVIMPLHPRTKKVIGKLTKNYKNIAFVKPISHTNLLSLIKKSCGVITDSGGIQKEAYWLGVQCYVIRKSTEWPETLNNNKLIKNIDTDFKLRIEKRHPINKNYFGDGKATKKITSIIAAYLNDPE